MPYHLHITNKNYSSWSLRPWLLLRQLNIPFTEEYHPLISGTFRQPQWHAFSPVAHVPCLHVLPNNPLSSSTTTTTSPSATTPPNGPGNDGEEEPLILWDSLAITEHLAEAHRDKPVYPSAPAARAWARSAVAEMHAGFPAVRRTLGFNVGVRVALADSVFEEGEDGGEELARELKRVDELWREGLERFGGPFLGGKEFTAVDAFFAPVVLRVQTYVGVGERLSGRARGYVERMLEVEGVREWVGAALRETGREVVHERESVEGEGKRLVADLRAT
ncbi:uncharacterized protein B0H64DRAFT_390802 [Chaetomium fimeti]|uniref:GST N-terminal domain-containing protein n=1 Tax=Chaetomium fimeti TaxID=1854472 RepID=A0AAE0HJW1_9PEZI|nr:hypothetical protein B0H64DRAFT_390802 [Chaetomium fimeti]